MSHRCGCGAVAGAAAARREGPPGRRGGRGARGAAARPALRSQAGSSLQESHTVCHERRREPARE